jgi:hypothetical protein
MDASTTSVGAEADSGYRVLQTVKKDDAHRVKVVVKFKKIGDHNTVVDLTTFASSGRYDKIDVVIQQEKVVGVI